VEVYRMNRKVFVSVALAILLALGVAGVALGQDSPETPQPLVGDTPISGTITGSNAGSFAYYLIDYPGGDEVVRIVVRFAPGDPATLAGVGFNVYGPAGFDIGESIITGDEDGSEDLTHSESDATRWLVQVYNYIDGLTVSHTIAAEGLPAPAATPQPTPPGTPTPPPAATPAPAMTPEAPGGLQETVGGVLAGSRAGAYDHYLLNYAGDNVEATVRMTFSPDSPVISPGVGFTIYGPSGQEVEGQPTGDPGVREATFALEEAGAYTVLVYNYIEGLALSYTIGR
jgi:hypothetical protein